MTKTAKDMVKDMVADPTLDKYFDRNPATLGRDDLLEFVEIERQRRADFITADASK